ncbi:bifunctional demethylmenaquinone methyltransferase/2-methoxy-6-polyprenyl-1,4-benzoquinol methylase [Marinicauda salina]|uniref:Ubiquinone/menaquinone biosynthesis C-methyltransferase UbiE n=1 Tax=Marinicauda salina TaxID=2135793 RepID=A0A2U2BY32_9PROT|nr:class I SAM-dependent methyltransferase [Marinicauda salina]PWE18921.1 bifunctional demethylmenaquinone methyltransferase/2-methoxy-6-polyprenyl-1,4-benzoquinol methylase [Marinicauda salina]
MTETAENPDAAETTSFGFREVPRAEKQSLVRGVFDRSARRYDLMNDLMSLGVHRVWKDITITKANPRPGETLIDVAGGTGDLARAFLDRADERRKRAGGDPARAVVADINLEMLDAGRKRGGRGGLDWIGANAEHLPFADRSAACVMIGFGIRNVTDRAAALSEMHRVLKPGGRFLCLEFSRPVSRGISRFYDAWSFNVIPELGRLIARDRDSYQYLVESIRRFPHQQAFAQEMEAAGFANVSVTNLSGGIAALHAGWRL